VKKFLLGFFFPRILPFPIRMNFPFPNKSQKLLKKSQKTPKKNLHHIFFLANSSLIKNEFARRLLILLRLKLLKFN